MSTYWQQFRSRQLAIEKKFVGSVYNELRKQNLAFLNATKKYGFDYAVRRIDTIVTAEGIVKVLKKMYAAAAYLEGKYVARSLNKKYVEQKKQGIDASFGVGFDQIADVVDEYFRVYQLVKSGIPITNTTKKYIYRHLINKVNEGVALDQAIKEFRDLAIDGRHNRSRSRAKYIMQMESLSAMSFGGVIGAYMSGVDIDRIWITCADEKVRTRPYSHRILDRQVASLFGSFYNGEQIKHPGDKDASLANTSGCRCCQIFKEKEKPKPRIRTRSISNFLTDFFAGFLISEGIALATGEATILSDE